jgi:hypothetical protein
LLVAFGVNNGLTTHATISNNKIANEPRIFDL